MEKGPAGMSRPSQGRKVSFPEEPLNRRPSVVQAGPCPAQAAEGPNIEDAGIRLILQHLGEHRSFRQGIEEAIQKPLQILRVTGPHTTLYV